MFLDSKAYYILIGLFLLFIDFSNAQDQKVADSLKLDYEKNIFGGTEKLELLRNLAYNEVNDLDLSKKYAQELILMADELDNNLYLHRGYLQKGNTLRMTGELDKALNDFFKSIEAAIEAEYKDGEAGATMAIADTYSEMENANNAELYYNKAIELFRQTDNSIYLATALLNAGDEFFNNKKYQEALRNFRESGELFEKENYFIGKAYNLGNIGMVYAEQGKDNLAKENINKAITILEESEDYYAISEYLTYMADIYLKQDKITTAVDYAQQSLDLAKKQGLKKQISESNLKLSDLYEQLGNADMTLSYYKNHIIYRDSLINIENVEKAADLRTNFEVSQKQVELDLANQQKRNQRIILGFTGFLLLTLFWYYKTISKEKKRSENLLLNILPEETAKELKQFGKVKAKKFDSATVLFSDFKGFTQYAENLSPEELVKSVDFYFSKFDDIIEKHGLEKIKTIGDAYMCVGGLHGEKNNHAQRMVNAAFEIKEFVKNSKLQESDNETRFDIRIGINTGSVVAGVVGTKKFAYDIWGDTVNVASRMESNSEPGEINISQDTYNIIKDKFECKYRGEVDVKNRGQMKMYFVTSEKQSQLESSILS